MVDFNFNELFEILDGEEFEERPVTVEEFVESQNYLGLPPLSDNQYKCIRAMSQIYRQDTLERLYGKEKGFERWKQTCNEVVLQLGKGSGKDYMSTIAVSYIVYLLLCLKDPAKYFGKPPGDSIDLINIAINAQQAKNVFFKGLCNRIDKSPWFVGKYNKKADSIDFDKNISCYSGHSEREAFEGYNVLTVILDEISGFAIDNTSGHEQAKTGSAIYDMYRASVDSRFPDHGKVILLSFPRYKNDYIQQRYNAVVGEKNITIKQHEFILNEELDELDPSNRFTVEWEEEEIISYKIPKVFALRRPTWDVNPQRSIEDFKIAFYTNPNDALARFACMPGEAEDAFFKFRDKIEKAFNGPDAFVNSRVEDWMVPDPSKQYYMHVDLAQKHDHCAVAMSHVSKWVNVSMGNYSTVQPIVQVDFVKFWTPRPGDPVELKDVKQFIIDMRGLGFDIRLVTFDRWNSFEIMNELKGLGMNSETLSVAKKHYEDMAMIIAEERLSGPAIPLLIDELLQLRIVRDKVDHPRKGSKDLSDAVCGSIYNAIAYTPKRAGEVELDIHTYKDSKVDKPPLGMGEYDNVIRAPKSRSEMPAEISDYLSGLKLL